MKRLWNAVMDRLVDIFVGVIVSIITTLLTNKSFTNLPNTATSELGKHKVEVIILVAVVSLTISIFTIHWLRKVKRYKVTIKSLEIICEYKGDSVVVHSLYKIKATRLRLKKIYTRREWFSNETFTLRVKPKSFKIQKIRTIGNTHEYYIYFPKTISMFSKPIEYKTVFNGLNKNKNFESFYWYDVISPLDSLTFDIRIPEGMCSAKATLKEFLSHEDNATCYAVDYNLGYKVNIKPRLGYSYKLEWEWAGNEAHLQKIKNN